MLQDDSYIESYISTIGVDFVSTRLQSFSYIVQIFSYSCLKHCLNSFHVKFCRKYVQLSRTERPSNSRSYVSDRLRPLSIDIKSSVSLTYHFSSFCWTNIFALSHHVSAPIGLPKFIVVLTDFAPLIYDLF